ncbi:hypothetical protein FB451DRAFT_1419373 [Mycena latifolia]|nr:hypothetical protein FB451DRAFT_1419373 [Mycena latifolia]
MSGIFRYVALAAAYVPLARISCAYVNCPAQLLDRDCLVSRLCADFVSYKREIRRQGHPRVGAPRLFSTAAHRCIQALLMAESRFILHPIPARLRYVIRSTPSRPRALVPPAPSAGRPFSRQSPDALREPRWVTRAQIIRRRIGTFVFGVLHLGNASYTVWYKRLDAPPIGALLLSVQAVQRALQFWQTGVYVNPQKTANHFSIDNWGDSVITSGQKKDKLVRRATKFMASVQKWDEDRWVELKAAASEWVELPGRKRGGSSRSGSEAEDNAVLEEDDEIIILSD